MDFTTGIVRTSRNVKRRYDDVISVMVKQIIMVKLYQCERQKFSICMYCSYHTYVKFMEVKLMAGLTVFKVSNMMVYLSDVTDVSGN